MKATALILVELDLADDECADLSRQTQSVLDRWRQQIRYATAAPGVATRAVRASVLPCAPETIAAAFSALATALEHTTDGD